MTQYELDETDMRLLSLLQENARYTALELAEEVGVSDNTIHNRMDRLEEAGIITGYATTVDHARAGLELHFLFVCTARISERSTVAQEILDIPEVVEVTELMTGERNLLVKVVGAEDDDITRIAESLDERDLEINDENLIKIERRSHLDYFEVESLVSDE